MQSSAATVMAKARQEARSPDDGSVLRRVIDIIGHPLTAYIAGLNSTRPLHDESVQFTESQFDRLRYVYYLTRILADVESPRIFQAWMQGANPLLEDTSPARLLRERDKTYTRQKISEAAWQFLTFG